MQRSKIGIRVSDTLRRGALQPLPSFDWISLTRNTTDQISAQHQLALSVAEFCSTPEPALGGRSIHRQVVSASMQRTKSEHGTAVTFGGSFSNRPLGSSTF
jgi:hypothetical protein